ncbi:hypothetical protein GCM10027515_24440 [Schumannella luteola]|uniref:Di/tricarboxylate transporter n=1 Tax=Schumannella luteola TaxID=472059 RepID=A0A852YKN6_9MICO|nr:hypothetical protein [Schumannella luteola]NYG99758.1 di/tricarboxylate transporter [Schumannella luteola]TPX06535.1 hypothetical protein FJ656_00875 [Schumannella luteola]
MIDWAAFFIVAAAALVAASAIVTLFSLALRFGDGGATGSWQRRVSVGLYVLCALVVLFGIYLIVPALHGG